jgi:gamma-glutamyl:cysteine ligase YbdK (ATP-grasp superfamily)
MTEKECAIIYQTAGVKTVSDVTPIIDAEADQKAALERSQDELICKITDIAADYNERMMAVIMPLQKALDKTNQMLEDYNRPACFGTYTCSDRDLENCPVRTSGACYRKVRGCC